MRTARTKLGSVAYRAVGAGPPLVLITGYGGTMESWDRRFVDTLAERCHVVILDNAGIGQTRALRTPLTIDATASQTSALISALGFQRPDVLGWSMGSMVAQALAVLHPDRGGILPGRARGVRNHRRRESPLPTQRVFWILWTAGRVTKSPELGCASHDAHQPGPQQMAGHGSGWR